MFRDRVTRDGSSGFKAEPGRYQLVTAPSCPWAHRTVLMRKLKRLESAIPLLESDLPKGEGWAYSRGFDDLRRKTASFTSTRSTPPPGPTIPAAPRCRCCGTGRRRTIVNNKSSEIIRMLNAEFDAFGDAALDLYPPDAAPRHRRDQRLRLRHHQQRRVPRRTGEKPNRLRRGIQQAVRSLRRTRNPARNTALAGRRPFHRSRSAPLPDPFAFRHGLLRAVQVQSAAPDRLPQSVELHARDLPDARRRRDRRFRENQSSAITAA